MTTNKISYGVLATTNGGFRIIHVSWYSSLTGPSIGIVTGINSNGERKSYIGTCTGTDEIANACHIAIHGSPFYPNTFRDFVS